MTTIVINHVILDEVAADAALRAPAWAAAIARAAAYLRAQPRVELCDGGGIVYHSESRKGEVYTATPTTCRCAEWSGRRTVPAGHACRPRAAARLAHLVAQRQSYACIYCATTLLPGLTPAGEHVLECLRCGHAVHRAVVPPPPQPGLIIRI